MVKRAKPFDYFNYIRFGDVVHSELAMQTQYASRHLAGEHGFADLGSDLRWYGSTGDYHGLMIHRDDAAEFVKRVISRRNALGVVQ